MSTTEYEQGANHWRRLFDLDRPDAVRAACRGSGNPAALAWLAEALELTDDSLVIDVGGGLGGPCAWLHDHYGCSTLSIDPVADATRCATEVFGVAGAVADGAHLPVPDASFDAALLLGVLSVVDEPRLILAETARVSAQVGLIAYCSTGGSAVRCGGSRFGTPAELHDLLHATGWHLRLGPCPPGLPPPPDWSDADVDGAAESVGTDDPDEREVVAALADGRIEPLVAVARTAMHR